MSREKEEKIVFITLIVAILLFGLIFQKGLFYLFIVYWTNKLLSYTSFKFKIDRLKGKVTPIYKVWQSSFGHYAVSKYEVQYTPFLYRWFIPFGGLIEEQTYVETGHYITENILDLDSLEDFYEEQFRLDRIKICAKKTKEGVLKKKIDRLNNTYNQNYK